jgi:hypothetical protein
MSHDGQPITEARIKAALVVVASIIADGSPEYLPILERLENELERFKAGRDPRSRALAILKAYEAENENAAAR